MFEISKSLPSYINATVAIKLCLMALNLIVYSFGVSTFNASFALIHASALLVINIFKAGASFYGIRQGGGASEYSMNDFWKRLFLVVIGLIFFCLLSKARLFFVCLGAFPISIIWLKAYDNHMKGNLIGTSLLSSIPILTSLLSILACFFRLDTITLEFEKLSSLIYPVTVFLGYCLWTLRKKSIDIFTEMMHANVSPLMIGFIVSFSSEADMSLALICFKIFESMTQIAVLVLTGLRTKFNVNIYSKKFVPVISALAFGLLILAFIVNGVIQNTLVVAISVWSFIYYLVTYFMVLNSKQRSFVFVFGSLLIFWFATWVGLGYIGVMIILHGFLSVIVINLRIAR